MLGIAELLSIASSEVMCR